MLCPLSLASHRRLGAGLHVARCVSRLKPRRLCHENLGVQLSVEVGGGVVRLVHCQTVASALVYEKAEGLEGDGVRELTVVVDTFDLCEPLSTQPCLETDDLVVHVAFDIESPRRADDVHAPVAHNEGPCAVAVVAPASICLSCSTVLFVIKIYSTLQMMAESIGTD